jgi:flavin reductase (DIM6/NTAB) family NADH-FMN oxidoreductase RutF
MSVAFGANILAEDQEAMAHYFARPEQEPESGRQLGVTFHPSPRGTPLLTGTLVQLGCSLVSAVEAGDHSIFIGEVADVHAREGRPLLFHGGQFQKFGSAG